jgi:outer membrane protein OmpA-like peptidoglycan-associated protein
MSSAKKIGLVAIVLAVGLTLFLISDRFKSTVTPDQSKKKSETHTIPTKKENNTVKQETKVEKEADTKHEPLRKIEPQTTHTVSPSVTSKNTSSVLTPAVPVLDESNPNEAVATNEESNENEVVDSESPENIVSELPKDENVLLKPKGKYFKFEVSSTESSSVPTVIHSVDLDKGRELASYKTNSYIDILPNKKPLTLVCGVFGYKLVQKVVDYTNPSLTEGAYQDERGAWVIPYTLEPLEKGDVSVMYNVAFYKDAVVMLPQSKQDLDELVDMMQTDQDYKIKIHGHCNGNHRRRIIALGDSKNYFDINGSLEVHGTAKQLSAFRADAVRSYLLEKNIEPARLKTQAWGGTYQLVDENSPNAKLNDRIEIEILRDGRYVARNSK